MKVSDLTVEVHDIKGTCPVYQPGDTFYIKLGFKLVAEKELCLHSLASVIPYYTALSRGVSACDLGLGKAGSTAFVQCPDPCAYTGGGTVVLAITPALD